MSIDDCEDTIISFRCREVCDEVHCDGFPWSFGYFIGFQRDLSRLTTLGQAAGDDKGLKVKVIDEQDKMGKGKGEDAEGK